MACMEMASAGSLTATLGIGKHVLMLVWPLLIAVILICCCIVLATVGDGSFFSLLEGRGEIAYVEIAGGGFSNAEIAEDEGECTSALVHLLLTTILFPGCFIIAGNQKLL